MEIPMKYKIRGNHHQHAILRRINEGPFARQYHPRREKDFSHLLARWLAMARFYWNTPNINFLPND